jgi:hypothetical protein
MSIVRLDGLLGRGRDVKTAGGELDYGDYLVMR